jgi:hypothetical protein
MKNKKIVIALVALVAVVGLMLGVWAANRPETSEGTKAYTVTVVHADGSQKVFEYTTDAEYLDDALMEEGLIAGEEGPYGLTLITVDGEDAVWETDNAYWSLYIGQEYATTGLSDTPVNDGDVFKLEYTRFE